MGELLDRYENHPIHGELKKLSSLIDGCEETVKKKNDRNVMENFERLRLVINAVKERFENTDPLMIPVGVLNALHQHIGPMIGEVTNFNNTGNLAHLRTANSSADNVLLNLRNVVSPGGIEGLKNSIVSVRRLADRVSKGIEVEFSGLRDKFSSLSREFESVRSDISGQKGRVDGAITQFQQQFSQAEDRRRVEFEQAKDKRREDYEKMVGEIAEEFRNKVGGLQKDFENLLTVSTSAQAVAFENAKGKARGLIEEIVKQREKAGELITIITNSGMISGYQTVANEERTTSRIWQGVAIFSFLGLIGFAVWAFAATLPEQFVWGRVGSRAFVAVAFGILGAYAARQAEKHEMTERRSRKMELELAAIDPYLLELPVETRHKIKEELASRLFGQNEQPETITNSKTSGSALDLLRMALETINNLTKKVGG